jgi:hypothetical protein
MIRAVRSVLSLAADDVVALEAEVVRGGIPLHGVHHDAATAKLELGVQDGLRLARADAEGAAGRLRLQVAPAASVALQGLLPALQKVIALLQIALQVLLPALPEVVVESAATPVLPELVHVEVERPPLGARAELEPLQHILELRVLFLQLLQGGGLVLRDLLLSVLELRPAKDHLARLDIELDAARATGAKAPGGLALLRFGRLSGLVVADGAERPAGPEAHLQILGLQRLLKGRDRLLPDLDQFLGGLLADGVVVVAELADQLLGARQVLRENGADQRKGQKKK